MKKESCPVTATLIYNLDTDTDKRESELKKKILSEPKLLEVSKLRFPFLL